MLYDATFRQEQLDRATSFVRDLSANVLVVIAFPFLLYTYLNPNLPSRPGVPTLDVSSILIIVGCLFYKGSLVLRRTVFDYFFVAWIFLCVASHVFALWGLSRDLSVEYLIVSSGFAISMALLYRAVFAIVLMRPRFSTRSIFATLMGMFTFASVLGLMQRFGPGKALALSIGAKFADKSQVMDQATTFDRPTAIFNGPNMLGYVEVIFAAFILAWAASRIRTIKPPDVFLIMSGIGLSFMTTIACQSRSSMIVILILVAVFGLVLRRYTESVAAFVTYSLSVAVGLAFALAIVQSGHFSYLKNIEHTGLSHDTSYLVRMRVLNNARNMASDISPLGSATTSMNNPHGSYSTGYSKYSSTGIDNEWVHSFVAFGVWGPLWVLLLMTFWFREALLLRTGKLWESRLVQCLSLCMLTITILNTPYATRILKYETALYVFVILAVTAAWNALNSDSSASGRLSASVA